MFNFAPQKPGMGPGAIANFSKPFFIFKMNKRTNIIAAIILLVVIVGGIFMMNRQSKLQDQNAQLEMQVDSLLQEKAALLAEMDGLQLAFAAEEMRADSLSTVLADAQEEIAKRNVAAQKIKQQHTTEVNELKKEIEQLRKIRTETESLITQLKDENAALLAQNMELTETVGEMQSENEQLTAKGQALEANKQELEKSVSALKAASVKASNFQVTVDKKSGKMTTSAKKARTIDVSFDMNNIPKEHQGNYTLYLVITDELGMPVKVANPVRFRVNLDGKPAEMEAQQEKKVKLSTDQRIEFTQEFDTKLKAGKYKAAIYSEMGLMGTSNFVLS